MPPTDLIRMDHPHRWSVQPKRRVPAKGGNGAQRAERVRHDGMGGYVPIDCISLMWGLLPDRPSHAGPIWVPRGNVAWRSVQCALDGVLAVIRECRLVKVWVLRRRIGYGFEACSEAQKPWEGNTMVEAL